MGWLIMTPLFIAAIVGLWFAARIAFRAANAPLAEGQQETHRTMSDRRSARAWGWGLRAGALVVGLGWMLWTALAMVWLVPAGHVGVVYRFNDIVGQAGSGMQIIAPWEGMKIASTRVQRQQYEKLAAFSKETQDVFVDATLNYSVSDKAIQNLYRTVGPDWYEKLVPPRVRQTLKDETVRYVAVDIAQNREQIRRAVRDRLREQLEPFSVSVEDFLLDNIDFNPEFKNAIEAKQVATQEALAEQNRVQAAEFKKQQAIRTAQGEAQSTLIRKRAEAQANRLLARSLTGEVIQFEAIQKLNPNVQTILIPTGSNLILPGDLVTPREP